MSKPMPGALEPAGYRYLTPHGWVVTKTMTTGSARTLYDIDAPRVVEMLERLVRHARNCAQLDFVKDAQSVMVEVEKLLKEVGRT